MLIISGARFNFAFRKLRQALGERVLIRREEWCGGNE
jgi:hypothetical protein